MIINKRHKRYSSILTILFFILVVTYTNIGYANNLVEIAGISSFSRMNENHKHKLVDHRNGQFELRFIFARPEIDVMRIGLKIFDGGGKVYDGKIGGDNRNANAVGIKVGNFYSEKIEITDVRSGNYIKTAKQDNISLGNGESYEIKLSPSLCPENKKEFEDNIKIEYRIGNEI